jgi:hypothetical protein
MDGLAGGKREVARTSHVALLVLVFGAGCADDGPHLSSTYTSGARLRARLLDAGGGAVSFQGWHDRDLEIECVFATASDGVLRCLPEAPAWVAYANADCTAPVVFWFPDDCAHPPTFAAQWVPGANAAEPARVELHQVGAPVSAGPVYFQTTTGCTKGFHVDQAFVLGAAVAPTMFVAASTSTLDYRGDRLAVKVITTADGAAQILETIDPARGPCSRFWLPTGEGVCLANLGEGGGRMAIFRDDACSVPVPGVVYGGPDRIPSAIFADDGLAYLPGARIDEPIFDARIADTCRVNMDTAYELGRPAVADDFPRMAASLTGAGRLQAQYATDLRGRRVLPEGFYDAARSAACLPMVVDGAPGVLRCVPYGVSGSSTSTEHFADPACTIPVAEWLSEAPSAGHVFTHAASSCGEIALRSAYTVVAHLGPTFRSDDAGQCYEDTPTWDLRPFVVDTDELDTLPRLSARIE